MIVNIKDEIRYRGCKPNPKIIVPSQELVDLYELLKYYQALPEEDQKAKFRKEIEAGRTFLNEMYKIHNIPWSYYKKNFLFEFGIKANISPFCLPIKRVKWENKRYGLLKEELILDDTPHISYKRIEVSKNATEVLSSTYVHEITHTQLNHIPGLIEDYYDTEVLSIFNELLYAYFKEKRYAKLYDIFRIRDIVKALDFLFEKDNSEENYTTLVEACCYIVSTLKAYHLFYIYYYGNASIKKQILCMIQQVFNHNITVEVCLASLGINYENSLDVKRLEKLLKR